MNTSFSGDQQERRSCKQYMVTAGAGTAPAADNTNYAEYRRR
jgi:hypothetical protein